MSIFRSKSMSLKKIARSIFFYSLSVNAYASYILIPMDAESQENHLKAYGVTYWTLERELKVKWLLNYRGGSFLLPDAEIIQRECQIEEFLLKLFQMRKLLKF